MKNIQLIQSIVSIAALICLASRWINIFPPDVTSILYGKLFYILIGISFALQARLMTNIGFVYAMYAFGAACIIGAFLDPNSQMSIIKTVGLLGGVILSLIGRSRVQNNS